jgi:branched-chain amino acid transport system permease protein
MMNLIAPHLPLLDLIFIGTGYALSQAIVFRAGTFSVATSGLRGPGRLLHRHPDGQDRPAPGTGRGLRHPARPVVRVVAVRPLARLRGVYQAIASLAFVEILVALILYFENLTGGPLGFHNIPRAVTRVDAVLRHGGHHGPADRAGQGRHRARVSTRCARTRRWPRRWA